MWLDLTAILYDRPSVTGVALADAWPTVSHDRLTRRLQVDWAGPRLLERAMRTWCVWERGSLIMDDTVVPKPLATAMEGLAWGFSSQARQSVYGFSVGLLRWTDGRVRIPLGLRRWHQGGPSQ